MESPLKLKLLGHASALASYQGQSMLFDPWFGSPIVEGVVGGFPQFCKLTEEETKSLIGIHISHVHYDHCSKADLETLPKDIPIYVGSYLKRDFIDILESLGFKKIIVVPPHFEGVDIGPFKLFIFPKGPEDGSFDSSCVLSVANKNVYFSNDCIHPDTFYFLIRKIFGAFEGAFVGYASVNPFIWNSEYLHCKTINQKFTLKEMIEQRQHTAWEHAARLVKALGPRWAVPYASSYRFVTQDAAHLNRYFCSPAEIERFDLGYCKSVLLGHGETLDTSKPLNEMNGSAGASFCDVPASFIKPAKFRAVHNESELKAIVTGASDLFLKVFERQSKNWKLPIGIRVRIVSGECFGDCEFKFDGKSVTMAVHSDPDVQMEIPSGLISEVLSGKLTLGQAYSTFSVVVKWFALKPSQMLFTSWT